MGNEIDITNVKVSKYINGTPKIDKWRKENFIPFIDNETRRMSKVWKEIYKDKLWSVISEGLTEDMFDENNYLDLNIIQIINVKLNAFREGWIAALGD